MLIELFFGKFLIFLKDILLIFLLENFLANLKISLVSPPTLIIPFSSNKYGRSFETVLLKIKLLLHL